jgi:hypothetical protein
VAASVAEKPTQIVGVFTPSTGGEFTVIDIVDDELPQPLFTVNVYSPLSIPLSVGIPGFCKLDPKEFGPVHENASGVLLTLELKLKVEPIQRIEGEKLSSVIVGVTQLKGTNSPVLSNVAEKQEVPSKNLICASWDEVRPLTPEPTKILAVVPCDPRVVVYIPCQPVIVRLLADVHEAALLDAKANVWVLEGSRLIMELSFKLKVEKVILAPDAIPPVPSMPPLRITIEFPKFSFPAGLYRNSPELIIVVPPYEFKSPKTCKPVPFFTILTDPEMTPELEDVAEP